MRRLLERIRCALSGHTLPASFPLKSMGTACCPKCGKAAFGYARINGVGNIVEWWRL